MRAQAAVALLTLLLLAGCSGSSSSSTTPATTGPAATTHPGTTSGHPAGNSTGTHNVTLAPDHVSGTVPFNVTFTLDARPSDANASWTITYGDGTTGHNATPAFPATIHHTYTKAGNYTVTANVTFSDHTTGSAHASVALKASGPGAAPPKPVRLHEEGTMVVGTQGATCGTANQQGVDIVDYPFVVNATQGSWAITVTHFYVNLTWTTAGDLDLYLLDPTGKEVSHSTAGNAPAPVPTFNGLYENIDKAGSFAPGTYTIQVTGCVAAQTAFTVDAAALVKGK